MADNFPNWIKKNQLHPKDTQQFPGRINSNGSTLRHLKNDMYKGYVRLMANFSSGITEARRHKMTFSKCWKKKAID